MLAAAALEIGDDVAGVAAHGADLDPGDDATGFRPRASRVGEGLEPAQFLPFARVAFCRGGLQGLYMLPQTRIFRQAQHVAQPEPVAQVQNLGGSVVAVGPQQDLGRGPMAADCPDQTPDVGGGFLAGRAARRA